MTKTEKTVLDAWLQDYRGGHCTSQDICDELRDTLHLGVDEVTEYMLEKKFHLRRIDERMVWCKV